MTTVDFLITNPRHHLGMFRPVMEWLKDIGGFRLRVLSFCELRGFPTPSDEIERVGGESYRCSSVRLSKSSRPTQIARDRVERLPRRFVHALLWQGLIRWRQLQRGTRPSLVVIPNDIAFPYYRIVRQLRRDGIPFLLMQEGIRFEQPGRPVDRQYGQGGARAVAAWGNSSARYFERVGVSPDRIRVVGNPRLDELAHRDWSKSAHHVAQEIGVGAEMLLFVSNPVDNQGLCSTREKYRLFSDFLRAARPFLQHTSYQLVVKLHGGESLPDFRALISQEADSDRVKLVSDMPIYPLIYLSRGVIVMASTAGLEAMLMDRPVGVLPIPGVGYTYDYVETGAASGLEPNGHLADQLAGMVAEHPADRQRRRAYVQDQVVNFGSATEATGELVLQLIDNHQPSRIWRE
jgi:hypothetical protein